MSGPGGLILGALLCAIFKLLHVSAARQWQGIWIASVSLVIATSFFIMPEPELRGDLEEVQIDACSRPLDSIDDANAYWDRQLAPRPDAARPGWKEDSREMLQNDDGVVLAVEVIQSKTLRRTQALEQRPHPRVGMAARECAKVLLCSVRRRIMLRLCGRQPRDPVL